MKKVIVLFSTILMSFNSWSHEPTGSPHVNAKVAVQQHILREALNWNYSAFESPQARALVMFKITEAGQIDLLKVSTDNPEFENLVSTNLKQLTLQDGCAGCLYSVTIKFSRQ
jgi:hypothetical protein